MREGASIRTPIIIDREVKSKFSDIAKFLIKHARSRGIACDLNVTKKNATDSKSCGIMKLRNNLIHILYVNLVITYRDNLRIQIHLRIKLLKIILKNIFHERKVFRKSYSTVE